MRLLVILCLVVLSACQKAEPVVIHGNTMGTTYSVKVIGADVDAELLKAKIDSVLESVNDSMSTYRDNSELSRFNKAPVNEWFTVSEGLMSVILSAREIWTLSAGRFDVTIGPLVNLWGFGPDASQDKVPSPDTLAAARARVGMAHLQSRPGALLKQTDIYVDLSAIAKGYGVDQVAGLLEAEGLGNYLVEVGGELRARGHNAAGKIWQIAIELPDAHQRMPYRVVPLQDMAMATSGDYRNYFERDGVRYSHTIDPQTGAPVTHNLASVTVLASTATMADGLATAINVMGPEQGLAMAERQNLAVFVILKAADGFEARYTRAFAKYIEPEISPTGS
ncbi:MAG: FAD:protein FMN transferase [Pseudomonadales bacterium]|nr:FAD:protein FMN transferase [Pseudomonadales bacterium]